MAVTAITTVQVGRLVLKEELTINEGTDAAGVRSVSLAGAESPPRASTAAIAARHEDIQSLPGTIVPVIFTQKSYVSGYYLVNDVTADVEDWGGGIRQLRWSMNLSFLGTEKEVDLESRLSGPITRTNNFSVVGERMHAPPSGHLAYWSNATATTYFNRTTETGLIRVYRSLPQGINPRWTATPTAFLGDRVRLLDENLLERQGNRASVGPNGWELNNGLVRVRPGVGGATFEVASWSGGAWRTKGWNVLYSAANMGPFIYCSVLRNDNELVTLRLVKDYSIARATIDVSLRRGSRLLELFVQNEYAGDTKVVRNAATAATAGNGYVVQTANDANGNRDIVGSTQTFTSDTANCGITKTAAASMNAFIGSVIAGGSAVAGDAAVDLHKQYVGFPSELLQAVRR
jgi:hypothetical protein